MAGTPYGYWHSIASSADGTELAAVGYADGMDSFPGVAIWISTNSGIAWTETCAPTNTLWASIASSTDGTHLVAVAGYVYYTGSATNGGGIYTSTNAGAMWAQTSAPVTNWISVASSADGAKLVAVANGGGIYVSSDSGFTWTQTSAPATNWHSITSSADGTKLAAVSNSGGIWTAQATIQTTTTPGPAGYLTGDQNSAIELQYIGNGQFMPLSYVGTISAY